MKNAKKVIYLPLIFILISSLWGQIKEKPLSLEDCIIGALKNNFGVAVEVLNPEITDMSVSLAKEKFLPSLSFNYNQQETNSPSFSWIDAADQITTRSSDYYISLTQLIPTGGKFSVSLYSYKSDTNRKFQMINPRYGSTLSFSFTQPLLKDFGFKITRKEIIIARNNLDISENMLKKTLLEIIYKVEEAYWNFVYSMENLKVKKQSLKLAQDLLAKNKREVEIGMLAPIEILSAQSEVASREADILQAEIMVKNSEDQLKTIINLAAEGSVRDMRIIPADIPTYQKKEVSLEEALRVAIDNRPDLEATRISLKNRELDLSVARNQLLPDLKFQISYWSPGISGSQILYLNNDPLTNVVIGTLPGVAADALKDALNFKYNNWSLGLSLSIPITTLVSRAQYAQAKLNFEQAKLSLKNQEQQVFLEIRNAVRAVQTNYKRVQAYKIARELAEEKLEAEEKKLRVGLTTNYLVLQHQRDLANAQGAELKAIIEYNLSLAALDKVLGTSLKNKGIKISEIIHSFRHSASTE